VIRDPGGDGVAPDEKNRERQTPHPPNVRRDRRVGDD
jgi:hypothetical protein